MNIINLKTGQPFDAMPRLHHRELAVEGASSVTSRSRNLLGLRGAMMVGRKSPEPTVLDRMEWTFRPNSETFTCAGMLMFTVDSVPLALNGFSGQGGTHNTTYSTTSSSYRNIANILGISSSSDDYSDFTYFGTETDHTGYIERTSDSGSIRLALAYPYANSTQISFVKSIIIPTWCSYFTSNSSRVYTNCSSLTFVGRSREETKEMFVLSSGTDYTSKFPVQFPSAICHCTDGDFTSSELVA